MSRRAVRAAKRNRYFGISRGALASIGAGTLFARQNFNHLVSNPTLRRAAFAEHNAFFSKAGPSPQDRAHFNWRGRNGRWYGYRWYGPVFWPYYFGDYLSYILWPYQFYGPFWGYGLDSVLWGAFWPYGEFSDLYPVSYGYYGGIYARYREQQPAFASTEALTEACAAFAPGVSDIPAARIESLLTTDEQRAAFNELKQALAKAAVILGLTCPSEAPLTPVARLDAMEKRLKAIQQAENVVAGPLLRMYSLLTPEQKQRLDAAVQAQAAGGQGLGQLCSAQASFTSVPAQEIERRIRLDDEQRQQLQKLEQASANAANSLADSCPANLPETIEDRLEAAQERVAALIEAIRMIQPGVASFFASLTPEQQAALNSQTQGTRTASSRPR
ncbi:MAG TPA: Spy/CpxP family protein refolding chaperone [Hyphomicrobiales bacterium]|nr:Spy/CpxP family protein refolding chaperone [Hyphomicrobiales bacterium]